MLPSALLLLLSTALAAACIDADDSRPAFELRNVLHAVRDSVLSVLPAPSAAPLRRRLVQRPLDLADELIPHYGTLKPALCTGDRGTQHRRALQRAQSRAMLAAEAIRHPDDYQLYLRELYFNTSDPGQISFVHQKFMHVAAAAAATLAKEGPEKVPHFCWDVMGRCPDRPHIYASTITIPGPPTNTSVQHCDRYFELPADECSVIQDQWSVTLHELTHAVHWHVPTRDIFYGAEKCVGLDPEKQIMNAQNYQLFAKDVWCRFLSYK